MFVFRINIYRKEIITMKGGEILFFLSKIVVKKGGNMLNKKFQKIVLVFALILLLFSGAAPIFSIKVGAESYTVVGNESNENNEDLFLASEAEKLKEFQQQVHAVITVNQEGNQETATISDADLVQALEKSGYVVSPEIKRIMLQRGAGVTKIV